MESVAPLTVPAGFSVRRVVHFPRHQDCRWRQSTRLACFPNVFVTCGTYRCMCSRCANVRLDCHKSTNSSNYIGWCVRVSPLLCSTPPRHGGPYKYLNMQLPSCRQVIEKYRSLATHHIHQWAPWVGWACSTGLHTRRRDIKVVGSSDSTVHNISDRGDNSLSRSHTMPSNPRMNIETKTT